MIAFGISTAYFTYSIGDMIPCMIEDVCILLHSDEKKEFVY